MKVSSTYLAMAEQESYQRPESPFMGLLDPRAASLRAFQRYSRDPHRDLIDGDGLSRWVTVKQARVQAIVDRMAMTEQTATMADIAAEAGCTKATVSRAVQKLQAWAMYAIEVKRGRNGGVTVHKKGWERFWSFVYDARHRLKIARDRARINVASLFRRGKMTETETSTFRVATFTPLASPTFGERVYHERIMLALEDPEGEYDALHPLIGAEAIDRAFELQDERRRIGTQMEKAALAGDWQTWQELMELRNRLGKED